jgi:hypothetical protein
MYICMYICVCMYVCMNADRSITEQNCVGLGIVSKTGKVGAVFQPADSVACCLRITIQQDGRGRAARASRRKARS